MLTILGLYRRTATTSHCTRLIAHPLLEQRTAVKRLTLISDRTNVNCTIVGREMRDYFVSSLTDY